MVTISNNTLKITLHAPDGEKGYYRGTRFDWAGVCASCVVPMTKAVFWSYHLIACIEPYIDFNVAPGETFEFNIDYVLF